MSDSYWVIPEDDSDIYHYGVKGMKWGVRREAKRDARESVRAAMSYGEGAGNRRKLINKSVEAKKKKDHNYAEAFDYYREREDVAKAGQNARRWRRKQDRKKKAKSIRSGAARALGYTSAAAMLGAAGVAYAKNYKTVNPIIKTAASVGRDWVVAQAETAKFNRMMKKAGF